MANYWVTPARAVAHPGSNLVLTATWNTGLVFASSPATSNDTDLPAGGDEWTVSCWFRISSTSGGKTLVSWGTNSANAWVVLQIDATSGRLDVYNGAVGFFGATTTANDGRWHNATFTFDGTTGKIYLDGVLDGSHALAQATILGGEDTFFIGGDSSGDIFTGNLDQVLVYDQALSDEDRLAIVNGGAGAASPPGTGLIRHYHLDEGTGTSSADSIAAHNVTWVSGVAWGPGFVPSSPAGPETVLTPAIDAAIGTFSPTPITLPATTGASITTTLAIAADAATGAATVTWTNDQGLTDRDTAFTVSLPLAAITRVVMPQSGNNLCVETDSNVVSYAGGATYTVNGGSPIALSAIAPPLINSDGRNYLFFALNRRHEDAVDEVEAIAAGSTPDTWTNHAASGLGIWRGNAMHTNADETSTAIYPFTGMVPGRYLIATVIPIDPSHTPHAQYRAEDGEDLDVSYAVDQTVPGTFGSYAGAFDWFDMAHRLHVTVLGVEEVTGTTLTVTLSNPGGDGENLLAADQVYIERLISSSVSGVPIAVADDTIAVTFPDESIVCAAGSIGVTTQSLQITPDHGDDEEITYWFPYPAGPHTLKVGGGNLTAPDISSPGRIFADWAYNALNWTFVGDSTGTVDTNGNLLTVDDGGIADLQFTNAGPATTTGDDYWLLPFANDGYWTILYSNTPPVNFDLTIAGQFDVGASVGPTTDTATGKQCVRIPVTRPASFPQYCAGFKLRVTSTGSTNNAPLDIEIRDPSMDGLPWTKLVHPAMYDRLHGRGFTGPNRLMDILQSNFPVASVLADVLDPDRTVKLTGTEGGRVPRIEIPISRFDPVDLTEADADMALHFFGQYGGGLTKVTLADGFTASGLGLKSRMQLSNFSSDPITGQGTGDTDTWPTTPSTEFGMYINVFWNLIGVTSETTFVMSTISNTGLSSVTLFEGHDKTGSLLFDGANPVCSLDRLVTIHNELGLDMWFNFTMIFDPIADAAFYTTIATYIAEHLDPGLKCYFEESNEVWNHGEPVTASFFELASQQDIAEGWRAAYAWKIAQWEPLVRAAFATAGRQADCKVILGAQSGNSGEILAPSLDWWFANCPDPETDPNFDYLVIAAYANNSENWGNRAALDHLDIEGLVDLCGRTIVQDGALGEFTVHRSWLDGEQMGHDYGNRFRDVKIGIYEWSMAFLGPTAPQSHAVNRHPRMFDVTQARLYVMEAVGADISCYYTNDLAAGMTDGNCWQAFNWNGQAAGTGTEDVGLPWNYLTVPSQVGGALRAWAAASPTPTPTATGAAALLM